MSDLYERLKQIRTQKARGSPTTRSSDGTRGSEGGTGEIERGSRGIEGGSRGSESGRRDSESRRRAVPPIETPFAADRALSSLGTDWSEVAPEVYRRVTTISLATKRLGDAFDTDGRWRTLSPLTRRPAALTPVFLDIETSGLSAGAGSVAFLIGVGVPVIDRGGAAAIEVTQLFLNELGYEDSLIDAFEELLSPIPEPQYVTYNGASFDVPVLRTRYVLNRRRFPEHPHLDLLHITRRLYARKIGGCSLGAVEAAVLRRPRIDDISGSEAPERYLSYLETRDNATIQPVILHHVRDIAHLAEVGLAINAILKGTPGEQLHADPYSLSRVLLERGGAEDRRRAIAILEKRCGVAGPTGYGEEWRLVRELLAEEMRRDRNVQRHIQVAMELYHRLDRRIDLVRIAKILEHDLREYQGAIDLLTEWCGRHGEDDEIQHRLQRLRRKRDRRR